MYFHFDTKFIIYDTNVNQIVFNHYAIRIYKDKCEFVLS